MQGRKKYLLGTLSALCIIIMILDSNTALIGAASGIDLCIKTVIPALFPFIFLTGIITSTLTDSLGKVFRPIGKLFKIPVGSEAALILGFLGGYPIGAQAIRNLYQAGQLHKKTAQRMLTFCNNPGPAFLFGMVGCLFDSIIVSWLIWCIVILGSFLTAALQPTDDTFSCYATTPPKKATIESAIRTMAKICAWVILFKILLTFMDRWIFWILPAETTIIIAGLLELTNGCTFLLCSDNVVFRFCCATVLLSFGGICVTMQTFGVAGELMNKQYFLGKLFQTALSLPLSYITALLLFSQQFTLTGICLSIFSLCIAIFIGYFLNKNSTGNSNTNSI